MSDQEFSKDDRNNLIIGFQIFTEKSSEISAIQSAVWECLSRYLNHQKNTDEKAYNERFGGGALLGRVTLTEKEGRKESLEIRKMAGAPLMPILVIEEEGGEKKIYPVTSGSLPMRLVHKLHANIMDLLSDVVRRVPEIRDDIQYLMDQSREIIGFKNDH